MNTETRLKRLEKRIQPRQRPIVMFSVRQYDDLQEQKKARDKLLKEYLRSGGQMPEMRIWLSEIPGPTSMVVEERVLGAFFSKI